MIEGLMCHLDFFKNLDGQLKHENSHIISFVDLVSGNEEFKL
jgi:hypothetical protein